jgi:hypothetical protein
VRPLYILVLTLKTYRHAFAGMVNKNTSASAQFCGSGFGSNGRAVAGSATKRKREAQALDGTVGIQSRDRGELCGRSALHPTAQVKLRKTKFRLREIGPLGKTQARKLRSSL